MPGYTEPLEWLATRPDGELNLNSGREALEAIFLKAAQCSQKNRFVTPSKSG